MRLFAVRALTLSAALALALPAFAQQQPQRGGRGGFGGGFGGQQDPAMVLLQKSVQEELKLSDAQKADLEKTQETMRSSMREAFQSAGGDREKMQAAIKTAAEAAKKDVEKVNESLKPEQKKRLRQLELQFIGVRAFSEADVQKELNLTDKQKGEIKDINEGIAKDVQELAQGAQGDPEKRREVGRKIQAVRKEAMEKVSGLLTDDQKKSWSTLVGEKFDKFMQGGPGGPGGGRPGGNRQKARPDNQ